MIELLRNLVFYIIFYGGQPCSTCWRSLAALALGRNALIVVASGWSTWHRICVTGLLGIRIVVEGELPGEGMLCRAEARELLRGDRLAQPAASAGRHRQGRAAAHPAVGPGRAGLRLGGVERDQGAKALRAMLVGRAQADRRRPGTGDLPRGHARAAWPGRAAGCRVCRALQAARSAGGADRGGQRTALPPPLEAPRHDHFPSRARRFRRVCRVRRSRRGCRRRSTR